MTVPDDLVGRVAQEIDREMMTPAKSVDTPVQASNRLACAAILETLRGIRPLSPSVHGAGTNAIISNIPSSASNEAKVAWQAMLDQLIKEIEQ